MGVQKYLAGAALLLVAGCATVGDVKLIDESGGVHAGKFNARTRQLEGTINGKTYKGVYLLNVRSVDFNVNDQPGPQPGAKTVSGGAFLAPYSGRAILSAADGDILQCGFNWQGYTAIGACQDKDGRRYQLLTQ